MAVDRKPRKVQNADIRKRTPLEQAIAEQTNPNARWEAKKRSEGLKKTTVWVRADKVDAVKAYIERVNSEAL